MEIEITGGALGFGLFCIGAGLALMGYYIGKGLERFQKSDKEIDYFTFLKEEDLKFLLNLNEEEIKGLLSEHPEIPKVVLKGSAYYPKHQLADWMTSHFKNKPE